MSKSTSTINYSDPGYSSSGCIDVLFIEGFLEGDKHSVCGAHSNMESITHRGADLTRESYLRKTLETTPGYKLEQYDIERWIPMISTSQLSLQNSSHDDGNHVASKKRKIDDFDRIKNTTQLHHASWDSFRHYLDRSVPVKIDNTASFRDVTPPSLNERECNNVLPFRIASLPTKVLETNVTVQCAFAPLLSKNDKFDPQERDRSISFCRTDDTSDCPIFMGQEDQVTSEMKLKEVISWDHSDQAYSSSMAVCIAQEPILAKISSSVGEEDDPVSCIFVHLDGRASNAKSTEITDLNPPLAPLAPFLRLPSFLLLRFLTEFEDNNNGSGISIHDINLWHAPQHCCTNVHYDDRDNLLLVTEGVKTVELSPPGCIEASPIYSEHANHPKVLRWTDRHEDIEQSKRFILEAKRGRTHIISVSAQQGLFIPAGWWHRVESNNVCTAVNVWFDYTSASVSEIPRHMIAFRCRQTQRKNYEHREMELARTVLSEIRKEEIVSFGESPADVLHFTNSNDWKLLVQIALGNDETYEEMVHDFANLFVKCWKEFVNKHHGGSSASLRKPEYIPDFAKVLNAFLPRIELNHDYHLEGLVFLWPNIPLSSSGGKNHLVAASFTSLVEKLSPASTYIIAQAWERLSARRQSEVERSYSHFFDMFEDDHTKRHIRLFLLQSVDSFKCEMLSKLMP